MKLSMMHYHESSLKSFPWCILWALHDFWASNPHSLCQNPPQSMPCCCTSRTSLNLASFLFYFCIFCKPMLAL